MHIFIKIAWHQRHKQNLYTKTYTCKCKDVPWLKMDLGKCLKDLGKLTLSYAKLRYRFCKLSSIFCIFLGDKNCSFFSGDCDVILGSLVFPAAYRFLGFRSRNVKSFWQKQRFGWAWARKTTTDFSLEETQKNTFLTHTRFQAGWWMRAGNTIAFPYHFGIFMRIHMRVPMFLRKHIPNVKIFEHHVHRYGNTSLTHTRLQSLFVSLCGNTYVFTCSGSVQSRNTWRVSLFSSLNNRKHMRVPRQPSLIFSWTTGNARIWSPAASLSVLSHFSCTHASREIVLHLSRKIVLPYKTSV